MIGTLRFDWEQKHVSAQLTDDLTWTADHPAALQALTQLSPQMLESSERTHAGRYLLYWAANRFNGIVEIAEPVSQN